MKEPIVFKDTSGKDIVVNGLSDFIKKVWRPNNVVILKNESLLCDHINELYKSRKVLSKASLNLNAKSSLTMVAILSLGYLAKKQFSNHTKKISELEERYENLKVDYDEVYDLRDDVDILKAELFEMNERLHAMSKKEDEKEG